MLEYLVVQRLDRFGARVRSKAMQHTNTEGQQQSDDKNRKGGSRSSSKESRDRVKQEIKC
jgi:hypothetical protein